MSYAFVGDWLPTQSLDVSDLFGERQVIGNLECVVSAASASGSKAFSVILDDRAYDHIEKSGFAALSLANNHVNDAGIEAFQEMSSRLDGFKGMQFFGIKDNPFASFEQSGVRLAVIGCLEPCRSRGKNLFPEEDVLKLIRQLRSEFDRVIVTPHWGKESEYAHQPSPHQRRLAASWIKAGADGVVGHHPHVIQGSESIDGRPVYYSVGNLEFLHEEGLGYHQTAYGLMVDWNPSTDGWSHGFLTTSSGKVHSIPSPSPAQTALEGLFVELSNSLPHRNSLIEYWTWARRVGPIYIPKSLNSWRGRMRKRFWLNLAKCCVWSLMPTTLLLGLGRVFSDQAFLQMAGRALQEISKEE